MTGPLSLWRGEIRPSFKMRAAAEAKALGEAVAAQYGLTLDYIVKAQTQRRAIAWPRQHVMHALYATGRYSLPTIADFLGGLHHTTVLHGIRRHAERVSA